MRSHKSSRHWRKKKVFGCTISLETHSACGARLLRWGDDCLLDLEGRLTVSLAPSHDIHEETAFSAFTSPPLWRLVFFPFSEFNEPLFTCNRVLSLSIFSQFPILITLTGVGCFFSVALTPGVFLFFYIKRGKATKQERRKGSQEKSGKLFATFFFFVFFFL